MDIISYTKAKEVEEKVDRIIDGEIDVVEDGSINLDKLDDQLQSLFITEGEDW